MNYSAVASGVTLSGIFVSFVANKKKYDVIATGTSAAFINTSINQIMNSWKP